jgi:hypothetical protein
MPTDFWYRRSTMLVIWSLLISGAIYVFYFEPGKTGFFLLCPFRWITGIICPGCGSTRALHQLLHGNLAAAFLLNPLFVVALPFLIWGFLRYSKNAFQQKIPNRNALAPKYLYLIFIVVVSFWIFRNTPFYPFVS